MFERLNLAMRGYPRDEVSSLRACGIVCNGLAGCF
jgi:hypothetical protein